MNRPYLRRRRRLRGLADLLLDERSSRDALQDVAGELYGVFSAISGTRTSADTVLASGVALSPEAAAACTRDGLRTAILLRGLRDAIGEAGLRFPGETIEVIYAGTGPFAVLALPLMTIFSPSDIRFTLIDCHEESLRSVRALLRHFGFGPFLRDVIAADASVYKHATAVHIVVAEIMQQALSVEPQVEVFRNLGGQLRANGILVPERVTVDLVFGDPEPEDARSFIGIVAELSAATLAAQPDVRNRLDVRTVTLSDVPRSARAMYATTVHAFGRHVLREFDSGLTYPQVIWNLPNMQEGEQLTFWYELGALPGIRWERTEN